MEPTLSEVLEEGLSRLQTEKNTWKVRSCRHWAVWGSMCAVSDQHVCWHLRRTTGICTRSSARWRGDGRNDDGCCMLQVWQWPADDDGKGGAEFYDAESFRNCVEEQHLDPELKALLPKDPPGTRSIEKPAEAALRQRMCVIHSSKHPSIAKFIRSLERWRHGLSCLSMGRWALTLYTQT